MNDKDHSAVCGPNDPANCKSLVEAYTEFRGHSQVTETDQNGRRTITTFYQNDSQKGQPIDVTVQDGTGKNLTRMLYSYATLSWPVIYLGFNYVGLNHYWVHPTHTENILYKADDLYFSTTCTKYTYDETAGTNYSYGNLLAKEDQYGDCDHATTYRTTTIEYYPNTTAYLVGLPARQQIKNASNTVIADSLNIYDTDGKGKLMAVRSWVDGALSSGRYSQVSYDYDAWGNQKSVTTYSGYATATNPPLTGAQTTYTCYGEASTLGGTACANDDIHTYPLWSKNPVHPKTSWTYDYKLGVPLTETDPNGNQTSAEYDAFGRITKLIRPGNGDSSTSPTIAMDYHDGASFWTEIRQRVDTTRYQTLRRHYDGLGRQTYIENGSTVAGAFTLDNTVSYNYPAFDTVQQSMPYAPGGTAFYTTSISDVLGRPKTITAPNTNNTSYAYDGLITTVTDPKGNKTTTENDVWGRVTKVTPKDTGGNPIGPNVTYTYDELDRLRTATRGGVTTTLYYDQAGRKTLHV